MKHKPKTISSYADLAMEVGGDPLLPPHRLGHILYKWVECGPWVSFLMNHGKSHYYADPDEPKDIASWSNDVVGVELGSIVEGSDAEVGPYMLRFPFTDEQFWSAVDGIDDEAHILWEESNR